MKMIMTIGTQGEEDVEADVVVEGKEGIDEMTEEEDANANEHLRLPQDRPQPLQTFRLGQGLRDLRTGHLPPTPRISQHQPQMDQAPWLMLPLPLSHR